MKIQTLRLILLVGCCVLSLRAAETQSASNGPSPEPERIDPTLPNVLLIGDSISIGYTSPVRESLAGKANVFRVPGNASASSYGVASLDKWLGTRKWNVIHFNFGLHDAKLPPEGTRHADVDTYARNLIQIVQRLRRTGAQLIWATTTPIPMGGNLSPTRRFGDITPYNAAALQVMRDNDVAVDDLNALITPRVDEFRLPQDVHYTPAGYRFLAESVVASIEMKLRR